MARTFRGRQNPLLGYWKRGCENPTPAEKALEPAIAALGERYRHQYPFWGLPYFADFALLDRKVIIEVDGDSHDSPEQKEKDLENSLKVLELGWRVVRVSNEQALKDPGAAVQGALRSAPDSQDTFVLMIQLEAALARLRQNYPELLAARAKLATLKSQRSKAAARTRATKKARTAAAANGGACPQRKPSATCPSPRSKLAKGKAEGSIQAPAE